jgi:hypothetical protein
VHGNINEALNNIRTVSLNKRTENQELQKLLITDEHNKFLKVMGNRARLIAGMLDAWGKGNTRPIVQQFARYPSPYPASISMLLPTS